MLGRALGAVVAGTGCYGAFKYQQDEGFRRASRLWVVAGPVVGAYRAVQLKQKILKPTQEQARQEWLDLDEKYSGRILEMVQELKGMFTKYGQIGAGLSNLLSDVWLTKLRTLEDEVPAQPKAVVLQTMTEDYGRDPYEIFEYIADEPLGSASIGQVHRAVLRDGHREVAVKVQYPDSERLFRSDMRAIRNFMEIAVPEQVVILDELERSFESEFNYNLEAQNLMDAKANLQSSPFRNEAVVPQPLPALCTNRVLVMEYLRGPKLRDGCMAYAEVVAARRGITVGELEAEFKEKFNAGQLEGRYTGPAEWKLRLARSAIALWDGSCNACIGTYNYSLGWAVGHQLGYITTPLPPNAPRIMNLLMHIHGEQLLCHGVFNADPHAGNFLLCPDGRIGLIDYGSTKRLNRSERLISCVFYAALARDDKDKIVALCKSFGYRSLKFDHDVIYNVCRLGFDTFGKDLLGDMNIQEFVDEQYRKDPWVEVADNLTMAQFLSIRLRTVGLQMNHPVVCSDYWGPMAERLLEEEGLPYECWDEKLMVETSSGMLRIAQGSTGSQIASRLSFGGSSGSDQAASGKQSE